MNLQQYIETHGKPVALKLAQRVGSSYPYLYQLATGRREPSIDMLRRLIRATRRITPKAPLTADALLDV